MESESGRQFNSWSCVDSSRSYTIWSCRINSFRPFNKIIPIRILFEKTWTGLRPPRAPTAQHITKNTLWLGRREEGRRAGGWGSCDFANNKLILIIHGHISPVHEDRYVAPSSSLGIGRDGGGGRDGDGDVRQVLITGRHVCAVKSLCWQVLSDSWVDTLHG